MKQLAAVVISLVVFVPMALGLMMGFSYYTTTEKAVPTPVVTVQGHSLKPCSYEWQQPILSGLMHREFSMENAAEAVDMGEWQDIQFGIAAPAGYDFTAEIEYEGQPLWQGDANRISEAVMLDNGEYRLKLTGVSKNGNGTRGHGRFTYEAVFVLDVEPELQVNAERVVQGDVLGIRVSGLGSGVVPTGTCEWGPVHFTPQGVGASVAYVAIPYNCGTGGYTVHVEAGQYNWEVNFRVASQRFEVVQPDERTVLTGACSDEAQLAFEEAILPLYEQADEMRYWSGAFQAPVDGEVVASYGMYTYVNDDDPPLRNTGMDWLAESGAAVLAPAGGKIVFAGELEKTGNMIVIEHGGGLKSYFYYLQHLNVRVGDVLPGGEFIGTVGGSGIAEVPHLHYEARIGERSIDPALLFNGVSGLLAFEYQ